MKCLRRNRVPFWYCSYIGKEEIIDDDGNSTGDYELQYDTPVKLWGNISPARGEAQMEIFGNDLSYDKTIVLDDPDCPITETTVLFVDKEPEFDGEGRPLFDYIVKRAARSLNTVSYAVEKVKVT